MPTFILGAGFNADATAEAGPLFAEHLCYSRYQIDCGYPLIGDMIRLCFGLDGLPSGKSIEDLFLDAMERGDYDPVEKLAQRLRYADFRIASALASGENSYQKFFRAFADSSFLTFNYDSLPETFLFRLQRWYPHDGYGVRVAVHLPPGARNTLAKNPALLCCIFTGVCVSARPNMRCDVSRSRP